MILKCKPTYNFQSVEFEFELNNEEGHQMNNMLMMYQDILEGLMAIAPEQPNNKIKTITENDLPKREPKEPASDGQINYLVRLGVPKEEAKKMSKQEAWKMIQEMK